MVEDPPARDSAALLNYLSAAMSAETQGDENQPALVWFGGSTISSNNINIQQPSLRRRRAKPWFDFFGSTRQCCAVNSDRFGTLFGCLCVPRVQVYVNVSICMRGRQTDRPRSRRRHGVAGVKLSDQNRPLLLWSLHRFIYTRSREYRAKNEPRYKNKIQSVIGDDLQMEDN